MRHRGASWLAWSLAGLSLAVAAATAALFVLAWSATMTGRSGDDIGDLLFFASFSAFPIVGALIASRRPLNPIGWICLADGLLWMLIVFGESYGTYSLARPGSVPFPVTINALTYAWLWVPTVGILGTYLLLLFPDGRLPSRRWRPLAWISGGVILSVSVLIFVLPGPLEGMREAHNPFGVEGHPWVADAGYVVLPLLPLCMLASAASLVFRFRRSRGVERQQIKWLALAAALACVLYLAVMSSGVIAWLISPEVPVDLGERTAWGAILEDVMLLGFAAFPVAIGIAILRYRLYDIDLIINRTLVYGTLTATLVAVYLGSVVTLRGLVFGFTGGSSQLVIVASTLLMAALFNPLRRYFQGFVDRRFFRKKYDAARTLETFALRLRNETDLDELNGDLLSVVEETMHPEHAALWLRESAGETRP